MRRTLICLALAALLADGCALPAASPAAATASAPSGQAGTTLPPADSATPGPGAGGQTTAPTVGSAPAKTIPEPSLPVAASPTGQYVAAGLDGLTLYDTSTGQPVLKQVTDRRVRSLHWSPDGRWLLATTAGPGVLLIDPTARSATDLTPQMPGLPDPHLIVSWAPDSHGALVGAGYFGYELPNPVWLIEPTPAAPPSAGANGPAPAATVRRVGEGGRLTGLQWLPDNQALFEVSAGSGCAWALRTGLATGKQVGDGFCHRGLVSPDTRLSAETQPIGASFSILDLTTMQQTYLWRNAPPGAPAPGERWGYNVRPRAWSPDSRFIAYEVEAWGTWPQGVTPPPPTLHVADAAGKSTEWTAARFVPDVVWLPGDAGLLFATAEDEGLAVHLGDRTLATHPGGKELGIDLGPAGAILAPDGKRLVYTVTYDREKHGIYLADLVTGKVTPVAESPDLVPVAWLANGRGLIAACLVFRYDDLGGGSATWGRYLTEIRLLNL